MSRQVDTPTRRVPVSSQKLISVSIFRMKPVNTGMLFNLIMPQAGSDVFLGLTKTA